MIRARKRFGQHFLEPAWVDKVIRAIAPNPDEAFIEIGAGPGALTRPLAARVQSLVAVEIDRDLAAGLRAAAISNVTVVETDFLSNLVVASSPSSSVDVPHSAFRIPRSAFRVAGNLPYNVASPIMFKLAELFAAGAPIVDATVMLQREVADRLTAAPGTREYGVLSVLMQHVADIELLLKLPAGAFRPPPKVLSALVRLRFHAPAPPAADPIRFATVVQAVFTRRRKTLSNALLAYTDAARAARAITAAGLEGRKRPETLSVADFVRLADAL